MGKPITFTIRRKVLQASEKNAQTGKFTISKNIEL